MLKGYLKLIVMNILSKAEHSGYSLIRDIERETGCWRPSTGSIYPLLEGLNREGLVRVKSRGRQRVYSLTQKGKKELAEINKSKNEMIDSVIKHWKVYSSIADLDKDSYVNEIFDTLKKGKIPFKELQPELAEFRTTLWRAYFRNRNKQGCIKIRKVLKTANAELKKI